MTKSRKDTKNRILQASWALMEQRLGKVISMSAIAKEAGISRQAVYIHFESRTELMIATLNYVDEVKGLDERFNQFREAKTGLAQLDACVEVWGNYIPEIYSLAKALLVTRETDEAMAAAWNNSMGCLRAICQQTIQTLHTEGKLDSTWQQEQAVEMFWTMISIQNWEQLTVECGWTTEQYIDKTKLLLKKSLLVG